MIYSFARSLDISLIFEDRPYKLGETIEVTVELNARRDVNVRKGRIDLMYDVSWTATETDVQPPRLMYPGPGGRTAITPTFGVAKTRQTSHRGSYLLSRSGFLEKNVRLVPDISDNYNIGLHIHQDHPPYADLKGTTMGWSLVAVVDVARARDVEVRRAVRITVD